MPDLQARAPQHSPITRSMHAADNADTAEQRPTAAASGPSIPGARLLSSLHNLLHGPSFTQHENSRTMQSGASTATRMRGTPTLPGSIHSFTLDSHSSNSKHYQAPSGTNQIASWLMPGERAMRIASKKELSALVRGNIGPGPQQAFSGGSVVSMQGGDMLKLDAPAYVGEQYHAPPLDWQAFVKSE